ncbi:DUF4124 domain-containing protein [Porticoccus sp.]
MKFAYYLQAGTQHCEVKSAMMEKMCPGIHSFKRFKDMSTASKLIGTLLALALCLPLHAAKIYKWQDENGSWHYSETPPLEGTPETIKLKSKKSDSELSEEGEEEMSADSEEQEKGEEEQKEKQPLPKSPEIVAAENARKAENCEKAKKNLDSLTHRTHIRYDDEEKGEQRYLTEEERQDWLKKSRDQVKEFCQ